jgi:hypothetical protein
MGVLSAIENSGFGIWVRESGSLWSYPTIIFLHSLGLAFLVGMNVALDLRLLGFAPGLPIAPLDRLFPIMWAGFWINTASGLALLVADASTMAVNPIFYAKMACIAGAVAILVALRRQVRAASVKSAAANAVHARPAGAWGGAGVASPPSAKAVSSSASDGDDRGLPSHITTPILWRGQLLAAASLLLWAGAITAGRLTAYLGPVAGLKGR